MNGPLAARDPQNLRERGIAHRLAFQAREHRLIRIAAKEILHLLQYFHRGGDKWDDVDGPRFHPLAGDPPLCDFKIKLHASANPVSAAQSRKLERRP